uniref:Uncharacterized protein n=1 Tax=Anguilla anguilla TaxID=7936 RepID=A0A0E9US19_ANGAN
MHSRTDCPTFSLKVTLNSSDWLLSILIIFTCSPPPSDS